ncbi:hypothetical protein [Mesorhizobium sp. M0848]
MTSRSRPVNDWKRLRRALSPLASAWEARLRSIAAATASIRS